MIYTYPLPIDRSPLLPLWSILCCPMVGLLTYFLTILLS